MAFLIVLFVFITVYVLKNEKVDSKYRFGWCALMLGFVVLYILFNMVL